MMKLWITLFVAIVLALFLPCATDAQETITGDWQAHLQPEKDRIYLSIRYGTPGHDWDWGSTRTLSDLRGLDVASVMSRSSNVRFQLVRDAGTVSFEGHFRDGKGLGDFRFTPNSEFVAEMKTMGYAGLSTKTLFSMAMCDVSRQFVREMQELGYKNATTDDLIAMRIQGVTPAFVKELHALGDTSLSVDNLVAFRILGVSPDFVREMHALGITGLTTDNLVSMRIHGVSPAFVAEMKAAGYDHLTVDQLVSMRIHGVNAAFVKDIADRGYKNLSAEDLIHMKITGPRRQRGTI